MIIGSKLAFKHLVIGTLNISRWAPQHNISAEASTPCIKAPTTPV